MLNSYAVGFVCVAAVALAGADYYGQTDKAGLSFGQLGAGAYVQSIPERFSDAKAETLAEVAERERQKRWRQGGVAYLPEAPEGWTRRSLADGDNAAVMPYIDPSEKDGAGASFLEQMQAREAEKENIKRATRSWVYERGSEAVFIEVTAQEKLSGNSLTDLVATTLSAVQTAATDREAGYAVIGGVGFIENFDETGRRKHHFRVLDGTIGFGQEIRIRVHANASTTSTREILGAIDYDGMNSLLSVPMSTVGNDARVPANVSEEDLAKQMLDLRREFLSLRAMEAQYRMSNIDTNSLVLNTYAQAYGNMDGVVDLTGGKVVDMNDLIEMGYRVAEAALLDGKSTDEIKAEVSGLVDMAVAAADADAAAQKNASNEDAPEMSPELAAELGLAATPNATRSSAEETIQTAETGTLKAVPQAGGSPGKVVSNPLPEHKILELMGLSERERATAELGLQVAVKKFETKNRLPEGSCAFSWDRYRVECDPDRVAKANDTQEENATGGLLGKLGFGGGSDTAQAEMPRRLELSNGGIRKSGCVGSFCD